MPYRYRTIVMDPPWQERGGGKIKRGADAHYSVLTKEEILKVILRAQLEIDTPLTAQVTISVTELAFQPDPEGCHLWMFATSNHLLDALWLIDALGFTYKTTAVWLKGAIDGPPEAKTFKMERPGLGQYMRHQHELLLLAVAGKAMMPEIKPPSAIVAPRGKHSEKPQAAFDVIELVSSAPRLEMFARSYRTGWASHGNELPMLNQGTEE